MKKYRLTDGRDKEFELVADLEGIKNYLGEGYEDCKDYLDVADRLNAENYGMAGYQLTEV